MTSIIYEEMLIWVLNSTINSLAEEEEEEFQFLDLLPQVKSSVLLPTAGRRTQLFLLIFTEPGFHLLGHPCTLQTQTAKLQN